MKDRSLSSSVVRGTALVAALTATAVAATAAVVSDAPARTLAWCVLVAAPIGAALAVVVGRSVARSATRPLVDLSERMLQMDELERQRPEGLERAPTEVRHLEESFQALLARLADAVSRELEFAANAAHELRTPLTAIRLHAERARAEASDAGGRELGRQLEEIDRLVRLVDSLLVMARDVDAGIPRGRAVNVADLLTRTVERVFPVREEAEVRAPDEAFVRGDEELLGIALENLLDNARKFTPSGRAVGVTLFDVAGRVSLRVISPGARIAPEDQERLFKRFYRDPEARAAHRGHGLGLPLARHIARLHGGDVRCVSGPQEDARFVLDLPAWEPEDRP